jgi:hypothetical protein
MLLVRAGVRKKSQEDAMSTITTVPQVAAQVGKGIQFEHKSAPLPTMPSDRASPDQEMMYAWSIGITSAVRAMERMPRREECPPEVYIG